MSRISQKTFNKVAEEVIRVLYEKFPLASSTFEVAEEIGRDKEFVLKVLSFLEERHFVERLDVGKSGESYSKWKKWKLKREIKAKYDELSSKNVF